MNNIKDIIKETTFEQVMYMLISGYLLCWFVIFQEYAGDIISLWGIDPFIVLNLWIEYGIPYDWWNGE